MTIIPLDFKIGQRIRLQGDFVNESGVATDPSTVIFTLKLPDGTETEYYYNVAGESDTLTNSAVGTYYVDYVIQVAGTHIIKTEGTGILETKDWEAFTVSPTP